ncbi:hypothetical protein [Streptomyces sp. NBC_01236]|uniref:hypothetical protein n=1 Tax=Streptomyces sp. NBC_01236 TaxID=2903789 RepID=UPI002E14C3DF|nr:hypothetical protein OG324_00145 [Streptomyces sp. NBC_01236]
MDAADFVIGNLTAQIAAYQQVAATMRDGLTTLPDEERAEIEEAASILRQVRSGSTRPLLPLSVVRNAAP